MSFTFQNQKLLTVTLTGTTIKEVLSNEVIIDITDDENWNLLYHSYGWNRVQPAIGPIRVSSPTISSREHTSLTFGHLTNQRILKESVRFASKEDNVIRLIRILNLKQIEEGIKAPLTFKKLVSQTPEKVFVPNWFENDRESKLAFESRVKAFLF